MKAHHPRSTPEAASRIRKLHPEIKRDIRDAIRTLLSSPMAGRELQFELARYRSYRVRTYRIVYQINDEEATLDIVFVGPRRTVYEELRTLLLEKRRDE